ncbi:hypothetical protein DAEQUDRAFT_324823 [Daedalea quercina L-15889]|uniref:Uncharacterized protein n=1 Tax=Daedalea quercina L-15889 TaxID=1314783 RepID=A0A165PUA2_9APHY|nr:hypothetical protein DAEQUDRAFT_324823 [Daedalea quercina L-15889]
MYVPSHTGALRKGSARKGTYSERADAVHRWRRLAATNATRRREERSYASGAAHTTKYADRRAGALATKVRTPIRGEGARVRRGLRLAASQLRECVGSWVPPVSSRAQHERGRRVLRPRRRELRQLGSSLGAPSLQIPTQRAGARPPGRGRSYTSERARALDHSHGTCRWSPVTHRRDDGRARDRGSSPLRPPRSPCKLQLVPPPKRRGPPSRRGARRTHEAEGPATIRNRPGPSPGFLPVIPVTSHFLSAPLPSGGRIAQHRVCTRRHAGEQHPRGQREDSGARCADWIPRCEM